MPESTCLHIQDQEAGPIRVVDIPWISVRIGRAAFCEVRLLSDDLADEACRLYRRGRSWHLVPVGSKGKITVEGRPVNASCLVPFDVPFRVGSHCLTIRQDRAVDPDWQMYPARVPERRERPAPAVKEVRAPWRRAEPTPSVANSQTTKESSLKPEYRPSKASNRPAPQENRPYKATDGPDPVSEYTAGASVKDRWETRWRAVGAELKARGASAAAEREASGPDLRAGFEPVPLKEAAAPPTQAPPPPRVELKEAAAPPTQAPPPPHLEFEEAAVPTAGAAPPPHAELKEAAAPPAGAAPPPHAEFEQADAPPAQASPPPGADPASPPSPRVPDAAATVELLWTSPGGEPNEPRPTSPSPSPQSSERPLVADQDAQAYLSDMSADPVAVDLPDNSVADEPSTSGDHEAGREEPIPLLPRQTKAPRQTAGARKRRFQESQTADSDLEKPATIRSRKSAEAKSGAQTEGHLPRPLAPDPSGPASASKVLQIPSAKDILATHEIRRKTQRTEAPTPRPRAVDGPTLAREPDQWTVPAWAAGPPAVAFVMVVGLASGILTWWWTNDAYSAGVMMDRLLEADQTGRCKPLPESIAPPDGTWTRSTSQHLAHWAIFMSLIEPGQEPSANDVTTLSTRAIAISPLNPTARLTLAQREEPAGDTMVSPRGLGLSRDAASLSFCARRLLAAGNKEEALIMYNKAFNVLSAAELFPGAMPRFSDDPNVPRYLLPGEERVREILRELLSSNQLSFREWSGAVPKNAASVLAAARLLKEQGRNEADALFDSIAEAPRSLEGAPRATAIATAARAEALALKSRWKESERKYREAIGLIDDETIKRSWWFNLADVELRLDDETQWQIALKAALAVSPSDDISRRATEIQRTNSGRSVSRSTTVRAN